MIAGVIAAIVGTFSFKSTKKITISSKLYGEGDQY
jgi:hypothetical protein